MSKGAKIFLFSSTALLVLYLGYFIAAGFWQNLNGRYTSPDIGYYHGSVFADFSDDKEGSYWLRMTGKSKPQWYRQHPTNFVYTHLELQLHTFGAESNDRNIQATVELPSLRYRSADTDTTLSPELLAMQLLPSSQAPTNGMQQMEAIVSFIRSAGEGNLPGPNHHGHYFEEPMRIKIMHFQSGLGFGWTVLVWFKIWIVLIVFSIWRVSKKSTVINMPAASPKI